MGTTGRLTLVQAVGLLLIILIFVAACAWLAPLPLTRLLWALRIGTLLVAMPLAWALLQLWWRVEVLPDLLREVAGKYFERNGLCFAPRLEVSEGQCFLSIYFQNRYGRPAVTRVELRPPHRSFRLSRHDLPSVSANFECPGGAFGVVRLPFPVPMKYQGRRMRFEIGADTKYPFHRGSLLRVRRGMRVGMIRELSTLHQLATTILCLPLGFLVVSRPARATLEFPTEVAEAGPTGGSGTVQILWTPESGADESPSLAGHRVAA